MLCSKQFSPCKHTAKPIENLIHNLLHASKVAIISVTTYIKHLDDIIHITMSVSQKQCWKTVHT